MKKIFYSMMAVALCACSQSDVDEVVTPPQPENKGLTFEVVDNGFVDEDGTRVTYGTGVGYAATFEEGDAIGLYAIKSTELTDHKYGGKYPKSYVLNNVKLTLKNGVWKSESAIDFGDADILFAYAPYRADAAVTGDYEPTFTGETGKWAINTDNNRFFVGGDTYNVTDNSGDNFELNDWMGAVANVTAGQTDITFNMQHMRGMVELTTHKDVTLEDLTLAIGGDNGAQYHFTPYHIETADKHVYRILTTEYRSVNTIYATIKDVNIVKKYKKTPEKAGSKGAGVCVKVNIGYTPIETITVDADHSLASILTAKYGDDYATSGEVTSLRLAGTLSGSYNANAEGEKWSDDWKTLRDLQNLTTLDMYQLTNESIPDKWIWRDEGETKTKLCETLITLVLPNNLKSIGWNSLQPNNDVNTKLTHIDLPASVTTIANGAFWNNNRMSVRIPKDSQLQTIGNGAFQYVSVYTDPNNVNVLKIPASVTRIDNNAFANISTMYEIIFQSPEAPTIEGANTFGTNNALISVPNKDNYSGKNLFPGKTVLVSTSKINLTAENYTSPYTHNGNDGLGLPALCDGITNVKGNHWHSQYGQTIAYGEWGIYIDIALPQEYNNLMVCYTTRFENTGGAPTKVRMAVWDGTETTDYAAVGSDYTGSALATAKNQTKAFGPITATASYNHVRFAILQSNNQDVANQTNGVSANLAELSLYTEGWVE